MSYSININKVEKSGIDQLDFDNIPLGTTFTDHMFVCDYENGVWVNPRIEPLRPIPTHPAAMALHYGQAIFEGMKAYKDENGGVFLFRPIDNCKRLNISAKRLAMPEIPEDYFMNGLKELLKIEKDWIPTSEGSALYIRPFMFATSEGFHASPADSYKLVIAFAPSGPYF